MFSVPGLVNNRLTSEKAIIESYRIDPGSGRISSAADRVRTGKDNYRVRMKSGSVSTSLVMFRCERTDVIPILNPSSLGYLTKAVDTVRKQENRALAASGDKSLAGSKYLWLYSAENLPKRHQDRFAELRAGALKTARAWAIKESLRHFWAYQRRGWAAKHFTRWYFWATHSRLKPIIDAAKDP